jgi:hypothetical protein
MKRFAAAVAVTSVVVSLSSGCGGGPSAGSSGAPAGSSDGTRPGQVPLTERGRLARPWEHGGLGFGLPPAGDPALGAAAAVTASQHRSGRAPDGAQQVSAVYATLTDATHDAVPVWLVTYTGGVCIPIIGGSSVAISGGKPQRPLSTKGLGAVRRVRPGATVPDCYPSPLISVVDATSGRWIMSYADGRTDPGTMVTG